MYVSFDAFAEESAVRLRHALTAAYGPDIGVDAAAEAMAYGFEHWDELAKMDNPRGYLYRVGQTAAARLRRRPSRLPRPDPVMLPEVEPTLAPALDRLSEHQRTVVILVVGLQWRQSEVAELLDTSHSTVRTHLERGMGRLRSMIKGASHA